MKFLRCPHCSKQAVRAWELFIYPSPFWMRRLCNYCNNKLRFNLNTIYLLVFFFIIGLIIANLIDYIFSVQTEIYTVLIFVVFALLPVFLGKELFSKPHNESGSDLDMEH